MACLRCMATGVKKASGAREVIGVNGAICLLEVSLVVGSIASCVDDRVGQDVVANERRLYLDLDWRVEQAELEKYELFEIAAAAADSGGNLYVGARRGGFVAVFSSDGRFVRRIARRGRGPGELQSVSNIDIPEDAIWVFDPRQRKFERFHWSGRHLGTINLATGGRIHRPIGIASKGEYWALATANIASDGIWRHEVVRADSGGIVGRAVGEIWWGVHVLSSGGFHTIDPSAPVDQFATDEGWLGLVRLSTGHGARSAADSLIVEVWGEAPVPVWRTTQLIEWQGITRQERDGYRAAIIDGFASAVATDVRRALPLNGMHPPATRAVLDGDRTVWVRESSIGRDSVRWSIWTEPGLLAGKVRLPATVEVIAVKRDRIWTGEKNAAGEIAIAAYSLAARNTATSIQP